MGGEVKIVMVVASGEYRAFAVGLWDLWRVVRRTRMRHDCRVYLSLHEKVTVFGHLRS